MAQPLELWAHDAKKWGKIGQAGRDNANVTFEVEPSSQVNKGVSSVGPVNRIEEADADDGCYADTCRREERELAEMWAAQCMIRDGQNIVNIMYNVAQTFWVLWLR